MDAAENPYAAPCSALPAPPKGRIEHARPFAFLMILVFPVAVLLVWAGLPLPTDLWFEAIFVGGVLVVSLLAVPLAIAGLRTSYRGIAAVALLVGSIEASSI
ncbi:MAG: hypothetical protein WD894_08315 [Pirellulales bacterium]